MGWAGQHAAVGGKKKENRDFFCFYLLNSFLQK
jgi:hypothetical protein